MSSVVAMPRMATTLPLPPSALAMYSAGILPNAVLSPATYASCALVSVRPRSTTVTYTPLALTWATGLVSAADSNGKITRALILFTVTRSCSWLACSGAPPAVLTMTCRPGWAFSRSFLAWLAQYTMPPVKPCVADGMATPTTVLLACAMAGPASASAAAAPTAERARRRVKLSLLLFMMRCLLLLLLC
ncbi:hypothetical protein D3C72_1640750 [compost metagenome]